MSLTKYNAFSKVAELGSLTKAAEALGYSQPGISHMISSLEAEFGFPLFNRSRDACTLTQNGQEVLYYCREVIKNETALKDTVNSLNGMLSGSVRIGAVSSTLSTLVPTLIHRFSTVYSNIQIQLSEMTYQNIIESLKNHTIDIGFTSSSTTKGIQFIPLLKDPVCLIIPPGHPLDSYDKVPVSLLNGIDFIAPAPGFDDVYRIITDHTDISPNIKYTIGSDIATVGMVANNLGISVMSKQQALLLAGSVSVKDFAEDFHRVLGIAVTSSKHTPPAIKAFLKLAHMYASSSTEETV